MEHSESLERHYDVQPNVRRGVRSWRYEYMIEPVVKFRACVLITGVCTALLLSACGVQKVGTSFPSDETFEAEPVTAASTPHSTPSPPLPEASPTSAPIPNSTVAPTSTSPPVRTETRSSDSARSAGAPAPELYLGPVLPHRARPGEEVFVSASLQWPALWARPEVYYPGNSEPILLEVQVLRDDAAITWKWTLPSDSMEGEARLVFKTAVPDDIESEDGRWVSDLENLPLHSDWLYIPGNERIFIVDSGGTRGPLNLVLSPNKDSDKDGHMDTDDNCTFAFNPNQLDSERDGVSDACVIVEKAKKYVTDWLALYDLHGVYPISPVQQTVWPDYCSMTLIQPAPIVRAGVAQEGVVCPPQEYHGYSIVVWVPVAEQNYLLHYDEELNLRYFGALDRP